MEAGNYAELMTSANRARFVVDGKPLCPCEDCVRNAVMIYGEIMGL